MLDVSPRCNDRARNHQSEGEECHGGNGTPKPENLSICDQDSRQILEDGINGNGKVLQGLGAGVDHADKKEGDGKPYTRISILHLFMI